AAPVVDPPGPDPAGGPRCARVARGLPRRGGAARALRSRRRDPPPPPDDAPRTVQDMTPAAGAPASPAAPAKRAGPSSAASPTPSPPPPAASPPPPAEPRDVNHADVTALARLPGVGSGLAQRIVEERERRGRFDSPEALRYVLGMGPKKLAAIRPFITVRD